MSKHENELILSICLSTFCSIKTFFLQLFFVIFLKGVETWFSAIFNDFNIFLGFLKFHDNFSKLFYFFRKFKKSSSFPALIFQPRGELRKKSWKVSYEQRQQFVCVCKFINYSQKITTSVERLAVKRVHFTCSSIIESRYLFLAEFCTFLPSDILI